MILLLMAGLVGVACDSVSGTPVSMDAVVLELTPAEVVLAPGKSATLQAKARNSVGAPVQIGLTWRSSNPEVVTVDRQGNVTALRAGEAEVQVVYGKSSGNAKIRVTGEGSGGAKAVASVTLTPETASLKAVGDTVHLTASALNSAGAPVTGVEVGWASLDEMVATVSAGTVVARGNGTARITATAGGKVDTALVTVAQAPVSVSVMPGAVSLLPGQSVQLSAVAVDANGVSILGHSFTWTTGDAGVATVEAGKVVAVTTGSTVVRATSGSLSGAATVAVQNTPVATVAVSPASGYIEVGQTGQLTVTLKDASGKVLSGRAVSWASSNGSVATVSSTGAVTGASAGTTTITATSEGKTGTATLEVRAPAPAPVASVTVSPGSASVEKGKAVALSATPKDASGNVLTGRAVTWSSSNASVASVSSSGVVTGVAGGTATIAATSEGKTGYATMTVTVPSTGGGGGILASHDFEDGTLGSYRYPWTQAPDDLKVVTDPTGKGKGKVVQVRYRRTDTAASADVNRAFSHGFSPTIGIGDEFFVRGDVYIPTPAAGMTNAQRKLIYVLSPRTVSSSPHWNVVLKAWGRDLELELWHGASTLVIDGSSSTELAFDTWQTLEMQVRVNSTPTTADGVVRVWLNGVEQFARTDLLLITQTDPEDHFGNVGFGYQTQHAKVDKNVLFDELRYWDNATVATSRIN